MKMFASLTPTTPDLTEAIERDRRLRVRAHEGPTVNDYRYLMGLFLHLLGCKTPAHTELWREINQVYFFYNKSFSYFNYLL